MTAGEWGCRKILEAIAWLEAMALEVEKSRVDEYSTLWDFVAVLEENRQFLEDLKGVCREEEKNG